MKDFKLFLLLLALTYSLQSPAQSDILPFSQPYFHLTPKPIDTILNSRETALKAIEGICRKAISFQDERGAIIDPFRKREFQYGTPYIAAAIGVLNHFGHARDLLPAGIKAMEHATACLAQGSSGIPDKHGEFFISPLTQALDLYRPHIEETRWQRWKKRMQTPISQIMENFEGRLNNWRTYAMNGEWLRATHGLVSKDSARAFIEKCWWEWTQRERMLLDKYHMYQDWSSDPQSLSVEAVGRGNLASLIAHGYDGPSAPEIKRFVRKATLATLHLQSPSGQTPPNGRTDNHVFGDILYHLIFKLMAHDAASMGRYELVGQYQRASQLSLMSIKRWERHDQPWEGAYSITKNHFDPGERVGYQPASQWSNYSGTMAWHLAEALMVGETVVGPRHATPVGPPHATSVGPRHVTSVGPPHATSVGPRHAVALPTPSEIGGFAIQTDARFSTFTANAGGMQIIINLRGASVPKYGYSWTPLGGVRFSKSNWDDRLGPSDGENFLPTLPGEQQPERTINEGKTAASFGPAWIENGEWVHVSDRSRDYQAVPMITFVHPLLVKFSLTYGYVTGGGGPSFRQAFTVSPDGVLVKSWCLQKRPFAITAPLLCHDGRPLLARVNGRIASTQYRADGDQQNFISLNPHVKVYLTPDSIQSTFGWLRTARFEAAAGDTVSVFIFPRNEGDPAVERVLNSFQFEENGFTSVLGQLKGNHYANPSAMGGYGQELDTDGNGEIDIRFGEKCKYYLKRENGQLKAVEVDRNVVMQWEYQAIGLEKFQVKRF